MLNNSENDAITVEHTGLAVLLRPSNIEPSSLNPDFLRYNQIADAEWTVETPVIVGSGFSRVRYDNGVSVSASQEQVTFTQVKRPLELEDVVCPSMALRFLSLLPSRAEYNSVGIDPRARIQLPAESEGQRHSVLSDFSQNFVFEDVPPRVQARLSYNLDGRLITVYVAESSDELPDLRFNAHIHRDVLRQDQTAQLEFVRTTIESWNQDIEAFNRLITQFYLKSTSGP